jgi:hypothetical protein
MIGQSSTLFNILIERFHPNFSEDETQFIGQVLNDLLLLNRGKSNFGYHHAKVEFSINYLQEILTRYKLFCKIQGKTYHEFVKCIFNIVGITHMDVPVRIKLGPDSYYESAPLTNSSFEQLLDCRMLLCNTPNKKQHKEVLLPQFCRNWYINVTIPRRYIDDTIEYITQKWKFLTEVNILPVELSSKLVREVLNKSSKQFDIMINDYMVDVLATHVCLTYFIFDTAYDNTSLSMVFTSILNRIYANYPEHRRIIDDYKSAAY